MIQSTSAPGKIETLRRFINTLDIEAGTDSLSSPTEAAAWFSDLGWLDEPLAERDLDDLRRLREALRGLALENAGHQPDGNPASVINELSRRGPLVIELDDGEPRLAPVSTGAAGVVGRLLAIFHEAAIARVWPRLKACRNDECRWVYYDHSRNTSRRWCTSRGCGNLMAARAYRSRQRDSRQGDAQR